MGLNYDMIFVILNKDESRLTNLTSKILGGNEPIPDRWLASVYLVIGGSACGGVY